MANSLQAQWDTVYGPTTFESTTPQARIDASRFMQRVSMAMTKAAIDTATEATSVSNHANRVALSKAVLGAPAAWGGAFAQALASEGLDQTSADQAIRDMVAAVWNGFAGAV